jgi:hypothetical protein
LRDLLIITPTRKRRDNAQRLINAVAATSTAQTDLVLAADDDDLATYEGLTGEFELVSGPRMTCPEWSNKIAAERGSGYRALASLGDDHVPETPCWDAALLEAVDAMGGTGIAYGDDMIQHEALPTAPVVSSDIVAALGWFFLPTAIHLFCDNVWKDLGEQAGCLRYVPRVVIRHLHCSVGAAPVDVTYDEQNGVWPHDEAAWHAWRAGSMAADAGKVRELCRPGRS